MSYLNVQQLFIDLIKYNEENIELLGEMQIPITNIYYFTIIDRNNSEINNIISYLMDSTSPNPFDNFINNLTFDEEQICQINIVKSTLKEINSEITTMIEIANESSAKIVLILDIGLIFSLINIFKESEQEIHLYDFILHKFKNKINKLFLLDSNSILTINNTKSSVFDELNIYLSKIKPPVKNIVNDRDVIIYKYHDNLYWKLLDMNQKIEYLDTKDKEILENNMSLVEINDEEAWIINTKLSKICFTNLFENHSNVLDPTEKLKIMSIFE